MCNKKTWFLQEHYLYMVDFPHLCHVSFPYLSIYIYTYLIDIYIYIYVHILPRTGRCPHKGPSVKAPDTTAMFLERPTEQSRHPVHAPQSPGHGGDMARVSSNMAGKSPAKWMF